MRLFLISLLSLLFLSGCGGQKKKVIGEWKYKGDPELGLVFLKNGTGINWDSTGQYPFEWKVEKKFVKTTMLNIGNVITWKVEDDVLLGLTIDGKPYLFFERAK